MARQSDSAAGEPDNERHRQMLDAGATDRSWSRVPTRFDHLVTWEGRPESGSAPDEPDADDGWTGQRPTETAEFAAWVVEAMSHRHAVDCRCVLCVTLPDGRLVASGRDEQEPCERGTVGCCVQHEPGEDGGCETW
jgi:hypothetical protein